MLLKQSNRVDMFTDLPLLMLLSSDANATSVSLSSTIQNNIDVCSRESIEKKEIEHPRYKKRMDLNHSNVHGQF